MRFQRLNRPPRGSDSFESPAILDPPLESESTGGEDDAAPLHCFSSVPTDLELWWSRNTEATFVSQAERTSNNTVASFCPIPRRADVTLCAIASHSCKTACSSNISGSDNSARWRVITPSARRAAANLACRFDNPSEFTSSSIVARAIVSSIDASRTVVAEESEVASASLRRRALLCVLGTRHKLRT
jgi:hypothetical protein